MSSGICLPTEGDPEDASPHLGDRFFLHYLDHEVIELFGLERQYNAKQLLGEFDRLARLALMLCSEYVVLPAASLVETQYGYRIAKRYQAFITLGFLRFSGKAYSAEEFIDKKQAQYGMDRGRYPAYYDGTANKIMTPSETAWLSKKRSSTDDIANGWNASIIRGDDLWQRVVKTSGLKVSRVENKLARIPELLESAAFISDFVLEVADLPGLERFSADINCVITKEWVRSHAVDLAATLLVDLALFDTSPVIPDGVPDVSARRATKALGDLKIRDLLLNGAPGTLAEIRQMPEWQLLADDIVARASRSGPLWSLDETCVLRSLPAIVSSSQPAGAAVQEVRSLALRYLSDLASLSVRAGVTEERGAEVSFHFHGNVTVQGNMTNIGGNQYNFASDDKAKVLIAIGQMVQAALSGEDIAGTVAARNKQIEARNDITAKDVQQEVTAAVAAGHDLESKKPRMREVIEQLSVSAAGSLLASGIIEGLRQLLG